MSTLAGADTAAAVKTVLDAALVTVATAIRNGVYAWRVVFFGDCRYRRSRDYYRH